MSFVSARQLFARQKSPPATHVVIDVDDDAGPAAPAFLGVRAPGGKALGRGAGRGRRGAQSDDRGLTQSSLKFAPVSKRAVSDKAATGSFVDASGLTVLADGKACADSAAGPCTLASIMVGRHFHREGNAHLLGLPGGRLQLYVEREPHNQHDPNALLIRGGPSGPSCGHLPREVARVLSPLIDMGEIARLDAEVDAVELRDCSQVALKPVPVRLGVDFRAGCGQSVRRSVRSLGSAGPLSLAPQSQADSRAPAAKRRRASAQRSLLMNFGRAGGDASTAPSSATLPAILAGGQAFSAVAQQLDVVVLFRLRCVDRSFQAAIDRLGHVNLKHRVLLEQLVCGRKVPPRVGAGLGGFLAAVEAWSPNRLPKASVLEAIKAVAVELLELAHALAPALPDDAGWQLLARAIWMAPSRQRFALICAALRSDEIALDPLRDLVAMAALHAVPAKRPALGTRRLHSDLLVCNRWLESAGLKLPLAGLRMPRLRLTGEQEGIVSKQLKPTELLVISAYAGTGKTSTLRMYAMLRPNLHFLYVCFNVSVRSEAERTFPSNVTCKNIHQLAFASVGVRYKHKLCDDLRAEELAPSPLIDPLVHACGKDDRATERLVCATTCVSTLQAFWNSSDAEILGTHVPPPPPGAPRGFSASDAKVLDAVRGIWGHMCDRSNTDARMTHNGYLKLYSLSKPRLKADVVMLDEAQDCNPAIGAIIIQQPCARILVGDEHQSVYGFLGAQDMLKPQQLALHGDTVGSVVRRQLTRSFRFGGNIADVANFLVSTWKAETRPLLGCSTDPGEVVWAQAVGGANSAPTELVACARYAYIARSNVSVFSQALRAHAAGLALEWVGGVRSYRLGVFKDLCRLALAGQDPQQREYIEGRRFKAFHSLGALRSFAKRIDDRELLARTDLVYQHGPAPLLAVVEKLEAAAEKRERAPQAGPPAEVALTTVHKAKGLEWDVVVLAEDFVDLSQVDQAGLDVQELNMLYVAVTRAKKVLRLPQDLAAIYGPQADAVAMVPAEVALRGCCPVCGLELPPAASERAFSSTKPSGSAQLVPVGATSMRIICTVCQPHIDTEVLALLPKGDTVCSRS